MALPRFILSAHGEVAHNLDPLNISQGPRIIVYPPMGDVCTLTREVQASLCHGGKIHPKGYPYYNSFPDMYLWPLRTTWNGSEYINSHSGVVRCAPTSPRGQPVMNIPDELDDEAEALRLYRLSAEAGELARAIIIPDEPHYAAARWSHNLDEGTPRVWPRDDRRRDPRSYVDPLRASASNANLRYYCTLGEILTHIATSVMPGSTPQNPNKNFELHILSCFYVTTIWSPALQYSGGKRHKKRKTAKKKRKTAKKKKKRHKRPKRPKRRRRTRQKRHQRGCRC